MEREDLSNIPLAIELGWTPNFDWRDKMHGRTTLENPPADCVTFEKGDKVIWASYFNSYGFWQIALKKDGYYSLERMYYVTLEDALYERNGFDNQFKLYKSLPNESR